MRAVTEPGFEPGAELPLPKNRFGRGEVNSGCRKEVRVRLEPVVLESGRNHTEVSAAIFCEGGIDMRKIAPKLFLY